MPQPKRTTLFAAVLLAACCMPPTQESPQGNTVGGRIRPCLAALGVPIPEEDPDDWESVERIKEAFLQLVLNVAAKHPDSVRCELAELTEQGVDRVTSEDGRLSVFSWDSGLGGSMGDYRNVVQLVDGQLIQCQTLSPYEGGEDVYDRFYTQLTRVGMMAEDDIYLGVSICRLGGCQLGVTINAIRAGLSGIDDTLAVFMATDGELSNDIGFVLEGCHEHDLSGLIDASNDHIHVMGGDGQHRRVYRVTGGILVESF